MKWDAYKNCRSKDSSTKKKKSEEISLEIIYTLVKKSRNLMNMVSALPYDFCIVFISLHCSLASSASIVQPTSSTVPQHHRVRRLTGYRTTCQPGKKIFCSLFTYNGVTKKFCLQVTLQQCSGLD